MLAENQWLCLSSALQTFTARLLENSDGALARLDAGGVRLDSRPMEDAWGDPIPQMEMRDDGVAIVPVSGVLSVGVTPFEKWAFGLTDYRDIRADVDEAVMQGAKLIVFEMNSPGGSVAGLHETAEFIAQMADVVSMCKFNGILSCSAAEYLTAAVSPAFATASAINGSIGARAQKIDLTGFLEKAGIKVETYISGKFKNVGDPYSTTTKEQAEFIQASIDDCGAAFRDWMRLNRGDSIPDDAMEGQTLKTEQAIFAGLVDDQCGCLDDAIARSAGE